MDWLNLIFLAVLQGIAEFLPISSSGHLALGSYFLSMPGEQDELSIVLHFGTLLSIVLFYWRRIWALLLEDRRVIPMLIVGTIPAAVVGVFLKKLAPDLLGIDIMKDFSAALTSALMLPITGMMLLSMPLLKPGDREYRDLSYGQVILIGCFQAFAILPGISRSGSTILAGMISGLKNEAAATFSFLLAIPAILGAMALEAKDILEAGTTSTSAPLLAVGALIAFAVGWVSLTLLVSFVNRGRLYYFAFWTIPMGLIAAIVLLQNYMQRMIDSSEQMLNCLI